MQSKHVSVTVDLDTIRANAEAIRAQTNVPLIAVVKADAYGLGARPVADALASVAHEFAYFTREEAIELGRPGIVLGPPDGDAAEFVALRVRPTITNEAEAQRYGAVPCAVNVDTCMQRFGCTPEQLREYVQRCKVHDIWSHCSGAESIERLAHATEGLDRPRHGASSSLLSQPGAWLDAVRPGVALYRGALRVSTAIAVARDTRGPVGYTEFDCPRVGILLMGYAQGVRAARVLINGRRQQMREVGMNCTYVSLDPRDQAGDEVVLLGDGLTEAQVAQDSNSREHEVLCRYGAIGPRKYLSARQILRRAPDTTRLSA